jgi:hypothetical protein
MPDFQDNINVLNVSWARESWIVDSRGTSVGLATIDVSWAKCWMSIAAVKIGGTITDKKTMLWNSNHLSLFVNSLTILFDMYVTWAQTTI